MVKRIADIEVTVNKTETEALILEHNLIKQYRPPFNIRGMIKAIPISFYPIAINGRLAFHRGPKKAKGGYFGPFPSVQAVRDSMGFTKSI